MRKLEKNPFWSWFIIMFCALILSWFLDNSLSPVAYVGLFAGVAGFVNSLWLNHRINALSDALEQKKLLDWKDIRVK